MYCHILRFSGNVVGRAVLAERLSKGECTQLSHVLIDSRARLPPRQDKSLAKWAIGSVHSRVFSCFNKADKMLVPFGTH